MNNSRIMNECHSSCDLSDHFQSLRNRNFLTLLKLTNFVLCRKSNKHPFSMYSVIIESFWGFFVIPNNKTMLGCLKTVSILISLLNSANNSSVTLGSKISFTDTLIKFHLALWITLNPPWPIFSKSSIWSKLASLTA